MTIETPDTAPPVPPDPAPKRSLKLPLLIGGGVLVAILAAAGITYAVISSQRTPEAAVSAYLDELVAGDALAAQQLMTAVPDGNPVMLRPDTYAAVVDPISGYTVRSAISDGESATASVELEQGGETYSADLTLTLIRKDLGLFDVWRVDGSNLPGVYVTYARPEGMSLAVNGTDFGVLVGSYEYNVPALPGTYTFEPVDFTDFYTAEPVTITVRFDGAGSSTTVALPVVLTEAGSASAQAAVNAHLDGCLAQPVLAPVGRCGFAVIQDDATYTNIRWTLLARPTVTYGDYRADVGWAVLAGAPGSMRLDADYTAPGEFGTAEALIDDYTQEGVILSIDENGVSVFESNYLD